MGHLGTKIFIEDPLKRHEGKPEKELDRDETIRFETPAGHFSISFEAGELTVRKTAGSVGFDNIRIWPSSSNVIRLK